MRMTKAQRRVLYKRVHCPKDYTIWEDETKNSPLCIAAIIPFRWKDVFDKLVKEGILQKTFEKIWFDQYWFPGAISTDPQLVYDKLINFRGNVGKFAWQILETLKPHIGGKDNTIHPDILEPYLKQYWSTNPLTCAKAINRHIEKQTLLWEDMPEETIPEKQEAQVKKNAIMRDRQEIRGGWEISDVFDLRKPVSKDALRRIPALANVDQTINYIYPYFYYLRHGKYTISPFFPQILLPEELKAPIMGVFETKDDAGESRDFLMYNLHRIRVALYLPKPSPMIPRVRLGIFNNLTEAIESKHPIPDVWSHFVKSLGTYSVKFEKFDSCLLDSLVGTPMVNVYGFVPIFSSGIEVELMYVL